MITPVSPSRPAPPWPLRILYADDLLELRRMMRHMLILDGHLVETAEDGEEALLLVSRAVSLFDLIITDHHMPRANGLQFVRQLRTLPYAGKVVVFSSELSEKVNEEYRLLGVDLILAKPIFPSIFRARLRELFGPADAAAVTTPRPGASDLA